MRWPPHLRLVLEGPKFKLLKQSPAIRTLLKATFSYVECQLLLENPFPDNLQRDVMIKKAMRKAAKGLLDEFGGEYVAIRARLKEDPFFATTLTAPVSVSFIHRTIFRLKY